MDVCVAMVVEKAATPAHLEMYDMMVMEKEPCPEPSVSNGYGEGSDNSSSFTPSYMLAPSICDHTGRGPALILPSF
jgi:hypothetical protein